MLADIPHRLFVFDCDGTLVDTMPLHYRAWDRAMQAAGLKGTLSEELFYSHVRLHGGPAPVRRYLPQLIDLVMKGAINPGKVFDLTLPLDQVAEGYRAMDERRAIKTLLRP